MTTATLLLGIKIFLCRILDVSLGTMRTVVVVKGKTQAAAVIGFAEVLLWFLIVREALTTLEGGFVIALFYAGGYAVGTLVGGFLAARVIKGKVGMQIFTSTRDDNLVRTVREAGYAVSVINVNNSQYGEEKYMLFAEIENTQQQHLKALIHSLDEKAFMVVAETKTVYNGFFKK